MATLSMPYTSNLWLWEVLSANVSANNWRCAIDKHGWIAATHVRYDEKNDITYKRILSNGFKVLQNTTNNINSSTVTQISK